MKEKVSRWKDMILTLADDSFFDLMQIWLGEIKSPFNKQDLVSKLESFVSTPKVIERILLLIDDDDKALLSAIYYCESSSPAKLFNFFKEKINFATFTLRLINLEQRLLIYRTTVTVSNKKIEQLHLNPIIEQHLLKNNFLNLNYFIAPTKIETCNAKSLITPALLLSLFSFIENEHPNLKQNGTIKKRESQLLSTAIPAFAKNKTELSRIDLIFLTLLRLNLIEENEAKFYNIIENWRDFFNGDINEAILNFYCLAIFLSKEFQNKETLVENKNLAYFDFSKCKNEISIIGENLNKIFALVSPSYCYSEKEFDKLLIFSNLIDYKSAIVELSIFNETKNCYNLNDIFDFTFAPQDESHCVVESNFDVILKPNLNFEDSLTLASCSKLNFLDNYIHFTITKESFSNGISYNLTTEKISASIEKLTKHPLAQNLKLSFSSWEESYKRIRLVKGVVLILNEQEISLLIKSELLKPYILEELASGIYLLDETKKEEYENALQRFGFGILPKVEEQKTQSAKFLKIENKIEIKKISATGKSDITKSKSSKATIHPDAKEIEKEINKLSLPHDAHDEYLARFSKKLILFPTSVKKPSLRFEKREARGLDYHGKISIIKHAIETKKELLEISLLMSKNETKILLVAPKSLSKSPTNPILTATMLDDSSEVEIELAKVKSVRRLLSALFF